jgi:hypothetical protein
MPSAGSAFIFDLSSKTPNVPLTNGGLPGWSVGSTAQREATPSPVSHQTAGSKRTYLSRSRRLKVSSSPIAWPHWWAMR